MLAASFFGNSIDCLEDDLRGMSSAHRKLRRGIIATVVAEEAEALLIKVLDGMNLPFLVHKELICPRHARRNGHTVNFPATETGNVFQSMLFAKGLQVLCGGKTSRKSVRRPAALANDAQVLHSIQH